MAASDDMSTGSLMNMYVTFTFMIVFTFYAILLFFKTPRFNFWNMTSKTIDTTKNCGPFVSNGNLSPIEEVKLFPDENSISNRVALSLLVQFSVYIILYMIGYNSESQIKILDKVKTLKFKEYELKIKELSRKLNKLDMKEKYIRQ